MFIVKNSLSIILHIPTKRCLMIQLSCIIDADSDYA